MTGLAFGRLAAFLAVLFLLAAPLGRYLAAVFEGRRTFLDAVLRPLERTLYRLAGIDERHRMDWREYATALLTFNGLGLGLLYAVLRLQALLPSNPAHLGPVPPLVAFNTAVSFVTNTNWQVYAGETTLSHFSQYAGLAVQNFLSAATGLAVAVALVRGLGARPEAGPEELPPAPRRERRPGEDPGRAHSPIGNFWRDLTRAVLWVLLPASLVLALILVSQGVIQNFGPYVTVHTLEGATQTLPTGPVASQEAVKLLGTNGGGFFGANSAHPFENPTPVTNLLEVLAILIIPAALPLSFGHMVGDRRQGRAVLASMTALFVVFFALASAAEVAWGNPLVREASGAPSGAVGAEAWGASGNPAGGGTEAAAGGGAETAAGGGTEAAMETAAGTMEGKEVRFGPFGSALFATATTAVSCGAVDASHDSLTPLGGLVPIVQMVLGEVVFGGVGSGLYGMLVFVILTVFIVGLLVGRTPEYLGKKIEAAEMKLTVVAALVPGVATLLGTAAAAVTLAGTGALGNAGPHGLSEMLYAFASSVANNGSAFGGLAAARPFYAIGTALAMLVGRFGVIVPVLAIAGSLAGKRPAAVGAGAFPTHGPLFAGLLAGVVLIVGALTFFPALALGPVLEHLLMLAGRTF